MRVVTSLVSVAVTDCETGLLMFLVLIGWFLVLSGFPDDETVVAENLSECAVELDDGVRVIALVVCNSGDIMKAAEVSLSVFILGVTGIVFCVD